MQSDPTQDPLGGKDTKKGNLTSQMQDTYKGGSTQPSAMDDAAPRGGVPESKIGEMYKPPEDVLVASAVANANQLPTANEEGAIGSVPLEQVHPRALRSAPSRDQNKFDTSIDGPGLIDKYGIAGGKKFDEVLDDNTPDNMYPWSHIGEFHSSGVGKPSNVSSKAVRAYLLEVFFNDLYFNTSTIMGTCFFSWLFAYIGFSWWSMIFIFFATGTVYNMEYNRFNRNIRDDLKRTTVHETISDRVEETLWLNSFLSKFWVIYMPVLSQQVKENVNPILAEVAPGYGIDALSIDEFTLGTKAPAIKGIRSYSKTSKDSFEIDISFAFTPNDESDMTPVEAREKINPRIALGVNLGKSIVSKKVTVLTEDINCSGNVRLMLKFGNIFPNIKTVSVQLLEPPMIDFVLKPIGGDTLGLDIMSFLPGLKSFVKNMINSIAGPMLFAPNHLDIDMEEIIAAQSNDASGVLAVTVISAKDLQTAADITSDVNPYVTFELDNPVSGTDEELVTNVKADTKSPTWNETKYLLVNNLQQKLHLKCYDHNGVLKDSMIGEAEIELDDLMQTSLLEHKTANLQVSNSYRGKITYSLHWFPSVNKAEEEDDDDDNNVTTSANAPNTNVDEDELEQEDNDSCVGIAKLVLHSAKNLDLSSSISGTLNPQAELLMDGQLIKTFRKVKRNNEPNWEESVEFLVPSQTDSKLTLKIWDDHKSHREFLCEYSGTASEIMDSLSMGASSLEASPQGYINVDLQWKSVPMSGLIKVTSNSLSDPIGVLKIFVRNAEINSSLSGIGDIDPYFSVSLNNVQRYRSKYQSENRSPTFNYMVYVPVTSDGQTITISLSDYQSVGSDRFIGSARVPVSKFAKRDKKTGRYQPYDKLDKSVKLDILDKRGGETDDFINASFAFIPAVPVYSPEEIANIEPLELELKEEKSKFEKEQEDLKQRMEKNPDDYEVVEVNDPFEDKQKKLGKKEKVPLQELLDNYAGVLTFQISEARLSDAPAYLEVAFDDISFPCFISKRSNSGNLDAQSANAFIRDLEYSKLYLRITTRRIVKSIDDIIAEAAFDTKELLHRGYGKPIELQVNDSKVTMTFLYNPITEELPCNERVQDTGYLNLNIISGSHLMAADRNGKSDPFVGIYINGKRVYKTHTEKKTLDPVWNEHCKIPIPSRSRSNVVMRVWDWDRAGSNDDLGYADINLSEMEINRTYDWELPLNTQGSVKLSATFNPGYVKPTLDEKDGGGLSDAPLKAIGGVSGNVADAAGNVAGIAGAGLGAAAGGLSKGGKLLKSLGQGRKSFDSHRSHKKSGIDDRTNEEIAKDAKERTERDMENKESGGPHLGIPKMKKPSMNGLSLGASHITSPFHHDHNTQDTPPQQMSETFGDHNTSSNQSTPGIERISTASTFARTLGPDAATTGTLKILSGDNLGRNIQIKVSLTQAGRIKYIYKTKKCKADNNGDIEFHEDVQFKASPEANIILGAVSVHTLGKDKEVGFGQVSLKDPSVHMGQPITVNVGEGHVTVLIDYYADQAPPVPEVPMEYRTE